MTRRVKRRAALAIVVCLACGGVGATFAAFTDTTSNSGNSFSSASTFLAFMKNVGTASCGGTSDSVTVPAAGVEAGNTLIVRVGLHDRGSMAFATSASDSKGNAYQVDVDDTQARVRAITFSAYIATALVAGDTITVTHPDIDSNAIAVSEFRGIDQAGRIDQTVFNGGNSANPTATLTTTNANDLIVGSVAHDDLGSVTQPGGGWTALPSVTANCGVPPPFTHSQLFGAYQIASSTGTFTYNPTLSGVHIWVDLVTSYKG